MIELEFDCTAAVPDIAAASPTILLRLKISESTGIRLHSVALRCQIRIEPQKRRYSASEAEAVGDLFGDRDRWASTLKPLQLAFVSHLVPGFTSSTAVDLPLPCSYDFDIAAHKYLYALEDGEVPLLMLFSGTIFSGGSGAVTVEPVPWHAECSFRMPAEVWRETMALHFPGTAWLRLNTETFDALHRYRIKAQLTSWEEAVSRLLKDADR